HFQLSAPWFSLGVVTPERLAAMREEWARGEDRSPEHYRWRAFCAFLNERRPIAHDVAQALYDLGARDADRAMGEAIMHRVIELPECPEPLVAVAEASGIRHLAKAAARHRAAT
ncbi:MAG TPA: hypothetical protein VJR24_04225, partial [Gemmatimonadaceae bacterium]|nr:hypothetical protein [Gemmatimonadaceae bacterium]